MNPYHIKQLQDGQWQVFESNTIIWASCPTKQQAQRIMKALWLTDMLLDVLTKI